MDLKMHLKLLLRYQGIKKQTCGGDPYCYIQYIPKTNTFNAYTCDSGGYSGYIKTDDSKNTKNSENLGNSDNSTEQNKQEKS